MPGVCGVFGSNSPCRTIRTPDSRHSEGVPVMPASEGSTDAARNPTLTARQQPRLRGTVHDMAVKAAEEDLSGTALTAIVLVRPLVGAPMSDRSPPHGSCPAAGVNDNGRRFLQELPNSPKEGLRPCQFEYRLPRRSVPRSTPCSAGIVSWAR